MGWLQRMAGDVIMQNKILYIFKLHQLLLLTKTDSLLFFKKKHISPKQLNLQEKKGLKTCVMCF